MTIDDYLNQPEHLRRQLVRELEEAFVASVLLPPAPRRLTRRERLMRWLRR